MKYCPEENFWQLAEAIERIEKHLGLTIDERTVNDRLQDLSLDFFVAGEDLNAGDIVSLKKITDSSGIYIAVYRAIANDLSLRAYGYVVKNFTTGEEVSVNFRGKNSLFENLEIGKEYYLSSEIPGKITDEISTVSGSFIQKIGIALKEDTLYFSPDQTIIIRE